MVRRIAYTISLVAGLALLLLTLAGLGSLPEPHPQKVGTRQHKRGMPALSESEALAALGQSRSIADPEARLRRETEIFSSAIVHYWPGIAGPVDRQVLYGPLESWPLALLQRIEVAKLSAGIGKPGLVVLERRSHRAILAKGVGLCSQAALAIADYLGEQGDKVRIAVLQGHVVTAVERAGRHFIADPDFNVVLPFALAQAEQRPEELTKIYLAAGLTPENASRIARIYGPQDNKLVTPDRYMASAMKTIRAAAIAQWAVPLVLIALGAFGLLRARRQRNSSTSTSVPSATR